jgi:hypothetical protein
MFVNPSVSQFQTQFLRDFPFQYSVETLSFSDIAASGQFVLNYNGNNIAPINWNDSISIIQSKIQAVVGSQVTVTGTIATQALFVNFIGVVPPAALMTIVSNSLQNVSSASISITITESYPGNPNTQVLDQDVTSAFLSTNMNINPALFPDQGTYTLAYNLLSAHYLVMNLRSSSQGINGQYNFLQASKGVGSVNESFSIPERVMANPYWAMLTKTNYGSAYLQILLPQLAGQFFNVCGTTLP